MHVYFPGGFGGGGYGGGGGFRGGWGGGGGRSQDPWAVTGQGGNYHDTGNDGNGNGSGNFYQDY